MAIALWRDHDRPFGLMIPAVMILGIGYGIMWSLFTKGTIPNLAGIGPYLLGGSACSLLMLSTRLRKPLNRK